MRPILLIEKSTDTMKTVKTSFLFTAFLARKRHTIGSLNKDVFKNRDMRNELIKELHDVMADLEQLHHSDALQDLQRNILRRADGCVQTGVPDKDDWIINCQAQVVVYDKLMNIITVVKELMN